MPIAVVRLSFGPTEVLCHPPADAPGLSPDQARAWLDERFTEYECEPLRPLGKVLARDKLLVVAEAIGARGFNDDAGLRAAFARAAVALLGSDAVHIDVDARSVSA